MMSETEESSDDHSKSYQTVRSSGQHPIHSMHRSPDRKVCYFYKDGDVNFGGVKVAVNPRIYPGIESLHSELTSKFNDLPFGVRSIYTPQGRTCIRNVSDLANEGRYVCSTYKHLVRGLDISRVSRERAWNFAARPPSGKRAFYDLLRDKPVTRSSRVSPRREVRVAGSDHVLYHSKVPKKIVVSVSGEPERVQTLLLYRRTVQTFEQVLKDLSEMFEMSVKKMFTMDGRMVKSLSSIYSGPERYVVTSGELPEPWKFRDSEVSYEPPEKRNKEWRSAPMKMRPAKRNRMSKTKGKFKVTVTTGDDDLAGTSAQVGITVYGHRGDSGFIPLGTANGVIFQHRNVDEFEISVDDIGEIYKIRISHDDSGDFPEWFCDQIRLEDVHTKEEFLFNCGQWLSRDKEDGEICREIPMSHNGRHIHPIVVYELTVVTGDLWNACTDANVYVTIYGERGDSGLRQLYRSTQHDKFCMGQSDVFTVEAVSLGVLSRVVVGHDGTGSGRGWFLDQIIIKDRERTKSSWIFPCRRWLDEGEDDGKIVRELSLHDDQSDEKYKQELIDRVMWKFQSRAQVILYSKLTQRPLRIHSDGAIYMNEEEEDDRGVFVVLCKRSNYKIFQNLANPNFHLALDNSGLIVENKKSDCDEFIVRVQFDRSVLFESVKFRHRFISSGNTVGKPSELSKHFFVYCKGAFRDGGVVILWTSICQTLNVEEELFLRATGHRVRSAQFRVHKVKDKGARMFESLRFPNQFIRIHDNDHCDVMGTGDRYCEFQVHRIKSKDYVELESVAYGGLFIGMTPEGDVKPTIANDSKNVRFYPEIVELRKSKNDDPLPPVVKKKQTRPRQLSHDLMIIQREESEFDDDDWKVWVSTAETATNADVGLVVYGDKSNSGMIIIGSSGSKTLFQADNTDEFKINLANVGKIYKVRVELIPENSKKPASMKLKEVKLQHLATKETLKFRCNRWLSRQQDDLDIVRELPAVRPNQPVLPVMKYRVETCTGSLPGSDTEANVFVNLFGERGDMGKRLLFRSNNDTKFAEGQIDRFEFEAVSLGVLTHCLISHDGFGAGEGWFCQKVVVTETPTNVSYTFPCDMWLDSSIDDGRVERFLKVSDESSLRESPEKPKPSDWLLTTVTGNQSDEKMEETVVMYIYGDKGIAGPVQLGNENDGKAFGKGKTSEFKVNFGGNLGSLYKIRIGLKEENDDDITSNWFLQKLKMKSLSGQREILSLDVNQWMSRRMYDCSIWREVAVSGPGKRPLPLIAYRVEVYTGSLKGSETSATVFFQMFGSRGDSGRRRLFRSQNDVKFQAGQMDAFEIQAISLDEIRKVVIGHRCHMEGGGWYLEKVIIREGSARVFHLPCRRWLDAGMEDGAIERILFPKEPSAAEEKLFHSVPSASPHSPEPSMVPPPQSPLQSKDTKWKILVSHRLKDGAKSVKNPYSPDGVVVVIYGKLSVSEELMLTNGTAEKQSNRNEEYISQSYEVSANRELGELYKIRIGLHSDKNKMLPNIFVHQMKLQNMKFLKEYTFDVDASIADRIALTNWVEVPFGGKLSVLTYVVEVYTGDVRFAGTNANVHLMIVGERGDTGRRQLRQSLSAKKEKFESGNVDIFEIEAVDLTRPVKVVVGHDGKGPGSGWFLDKVLVYCKNKDSRGSKYLFKCGRWLDEDEGDGLTERVLELSGDEGNDVDAKSDSIPASDVTESDNKDLWTVSVATGSYKDDREIGRGGRWLSGRQMVIVVYGDKDKTPELDLRPVDEDEDDDDEKREEVKFTVQFADENLGKVYKVRIGCNDRKRETEEYFPKTVLLQNREKRKSFCFEFEDKLIWKELFDGWWEIPVIRDNKGSTSVNSDARSSLSVIRYEVELYTASRDSSSDISDVFLTLNGERGDTGRRNLLKPIHTEPLEFPNPVQLADEQQRFRQEYSNRHRSKSFGSSESLIPPMKKKSEILSLTDCEEIDRHAKMTPMDLAVKSYDALVSYLVKPAKNEIDRIRAIFTWITSQRLHIVLDFTDGDLPPSGTPLHNLLSVLIQRSFNGYSELLAEMCSTAKIPCKVIKGRVKGVGCWPGKRRTGTNDYCIVFVEGSWRFIDPHWGSICCQPQSLQPGAPPPPPPKFDSVLRLGNWRDAPEDSDINGCGYVSDDFYFLTDPEVFIYTHMSCDPSLQLLSRPVSEEEFWEMAYLREAFFQLEMTSVSHPKCIVEANKDGKVVLEFGLSRSSGHFMYELSKSSVDLSFNAIDGASLNRFVTMENTGARLTIAIRFPAIGRYKLELYGKDVRQGESASFMAVCEYAIVCRIPDFEVEPNPVNPRSEWGPGADMRTLGLKPVEPLGGTLIVENGEARVRFRMMKSKGLTLHGIVKNDKEILTDVVCSFRTEHEFVFLLKLSHSGTFLFQIFSVETKGSSSTVNICNYLVKSDQNLSEVRNFFPIDDDLFTIGDQTTEASGLHLRSVSHEYPIIDPLNENSLDITMSASSRDVDLRIRLERFAFRGADAEDLSKYSYLRQNKEILHISLVFPKFGFYKLSILTGNRLLYVYLINVQNSDSACSPFPVQSPNWRPQFAILKPRTGNLKANTEYLFRIKATNADPVSIEADGSESKLLRSEGGSDVWEGSLKTPEEGGGTLRIFSKHQLLLTYKVQSADEILSKKQKQEAAVKDELSRIKKMVTTNLGRFKEDTKEKKRTEEIDEKKKEFRANQGKYEKQEALVQWREEEAVERFLFHGSQNCPIAESKKFSNEVFGMAVERNVFCLAAVDLLDIRGILVGHTRQKIGDGWFLEKVVVRSWSDVGLNTCVFPCHRWLEKGLEDGKTERELLEKKLPDDKGSWWSLTALTGDPQKLPHSKDANDLSQSKKSKQTTKRPSASLLRLVVYGNLGKSEDLTMTLVDPNDPNAFSKGHSDEFKVKIDDVGDVFKIRIGFDDSTANGHSWLIDTVTLQEPKSDRKHKFVFQKHLRKDKDSDGWLEAAVIPAAAAAVETESGFIDQMNLRPASVCVYRIEVYNGENHHHHHHHNGDDGGGDDDDDVSTETELSICLVGEQGDSGMRKLLKSRRISSSVSKQQMDAYEIKVVDLLDLRKVIVGHGAKGQERFLDKVVVKTSDKNDVKESTFSFGRTLENGQTEVSLLRDDLRPVVVTTDHRSPADDDELQEISDIGEERRNGEDDSQEKY